MSNLEFSSLVGKTLASVHQIGIESIVFVTESGEVFELHHEQDCCESVTIDDVTGNFDDLIGAPILKAEEAASDIDPVGFKREYPPESYTWTFYKLATIKGYVDIRWLGESNGYYSESVSFRRVK